MSNDEWIAAADALAMLAPVFRHSTAGTICKRAHAGLIRARAEHILYKGKPVEKREIHQGFWWAEGDAALVQNWKSGDFDTWIEHTDHIEVFGVEFFLADIKKLLPKTPNNPAATEVAPIRYSNKVFIVHGRDEGPREAVANILTTLGLVPVILNRLPNRGRTVIQKIEEHSDVGFAVVLLTPDDEGNLKGDTPRARARQNVLLELGYFLGKLTRARVCVLVKGDVEIPSDWAGVINEKYDDLSQAWKPLLVRELKDAGYDIDANKIV